MKDCHSTVVLALPPVAPVRIMSMIKVLALCGRPMRLSPRAAEEWLREEVGKLLTDGAVTQIEVTTLGSASLRWGRQRDYPIAIDLRAGSDARILVDGAACAGLGDLCLLGMRPSVVVANDERSVVLGERRA